MAKNVVLLENVRIMFRHFSGKKDNFHAEGQRDFVVRLDKEMAELLERDGFVVKWLEPREEGDESQPTLKVRVNFNGEYPPQVTMVTSRTVKSAWVASKVASVATTSFLQYSTTLGQSSSGTGSSHGRPSSMW